MEAITINRWQANGGGHYRLFGPTFWADVQITWTETGWRYQYLHGNYTGPLETLRRAALAEIVPELAEAA